MTVIQGLLLDLDDEVAIEPVPATTAPDRIDLGQGAWVEVQRNYLTGADQLFDHLMVDTDWKHERRSMYGRVVDVPRLTRFLEATQQWPHDALRTIATDLSSRYRDVQPDGFATAGLCLYRHGTDSVAWHGDTIGRGATDDVCVAIVSLGAPRNLALRPRGGGPTTRWTLGSGDLLVMGGSCQRTFEHAVPKTTKPVGPRISVQFRPADVR